MNRITKYFFLSIWVILLPQVFYAQSASMGATSSYDRLEASFQGDTFSDLQLEAFEDRAKQKVKDFLDLAFFLQEKDLEESLRKHVEDQLRGLYVSEEHPFLAYKNLNEFLKTQSFPYQKKEKLEILLTSPFQAGEKGYAAEASVSLLKSSGEVEKLKARLVMKKQIKKFGEESLELWEVLIAEIKVNK
ncbi:MAG: hypothetical protein AAFR87_00245 [Bacteroidota bacterium]